MTFSKSSSLCNTLFMLLSLALFLLITSLVLHIFNFFWCYFSLPFTYYVVFLISCFFSSSLSSYSFTASFSSSYSISSFVSSIYSFYSSLSIVVFLSFSFLFQSYLWHLENITGFTYASFSSLFLVGVVARFE